MAKLVWDVSFKRAYKKRIASNPQLKDNFWDVLDIFTNNPFDTRLKTHPLTGRLTGLWASSVDIDCRLVLNCLKIIMKSS